MKSSICFLHVLCIVLYQFALCLADDEPRNSQCLPFDCKGLGYKVGYPFSNTSHPGCGLYVIDCSGSEPVLIDPNGGYRYVVRGVFNNNRTILLHDQIHQEAIESNNCSSFKNISLLTMSPQVSFELTSPYLTFLKCFKYDLPPPFPDLAAQGGKYFECEDYVLYYWYPDQPEILPSLPTQCSAAQMPLTEIPPRQLVSNQYGTSPFPLLGSDFSLEWKLSRNNRGSKKGKKVAIGIGAGAAGALVCGLFVFMFFYLRRKRTKRSISSNLISQSLSPDSSLRPDPEKGSSYFQTPIFSYEELEKATNNFDSNKELGDGGFGTVYYGELKDGRVVAVKRLYENNCKRVEQFMNEVTILSRLRHQNLVSLYGCTSRHSRELLLVYEYVPNGTVADHLHGNLAKPGSVTLPIRMNIAIESANALTYLHRSDIIHRDVKTNNILLDKSFHVKVADFGLSRLFPTDVTHVSTAPQGTPGYVDPEYYQCYQLTDKSDVYSFGVVLIELISSKPAVDISRHRHDINLANMAIKKIQNHALSELVDPNLGFESDNRARRTITLVAELAFRCLQQDKDMRPSMDEVLEVLRGIDSEEYNVAKAVEVDIPAEDFLGMSKNNSAPFSPVSVTDKWISVSTTPNSSA